MKSKKEKKLSLQKIKIAKLNRNSLQIIRGGDTEIGMDLSATQCHTDTCPTVQHTDHIYCTLSETCNASDNNCRSHERFCISN